MKIVLFLIFAIAIVMLAVDGMFLYGLISTVLFLIIMPFYALVRLAHKKMYGWKEKLGFFNAPNLGDKVIMYHGVSVGEVIALQNLIKKTKEEFPDYKLVVTTGTLTGQEIANKKFADVADYITYFPFDIPFCVNKFLDKISPSVVLIAETELWPTFAYCCSRRQIPLYTINGRMSDSTYKTYKLFSAFFKFIFSFYTGILTQSELDKEKFISVGAPKDRTFVMKNLKFDVKPSTDKVDMGQDGYRMIVAGSTHKGEDEIVLQTYKNLRAKYDDIKFLLAPRHLTRIDQITPIIDSLGLKYGLISKGDTFNDYDIIILDVLGVLSKTYSVCNFAFIGGSFNTTGGHNPLEATVYAKPTITGPSIHNFKDIYGLLTQSNAAELVNTQDELEKYMDKLLSDKDFYNQACKDCETIFNNQRGAIESIIKKLKEKLS